MSGLAFAASLRDPWKHGHAHLDLGEALFLVDWLGDRVELRQDAWGWLVRFV